MPGKLDLYLEAEKRGLLPPDKQGVLDEARKRGLVPAPPELGGPPDATSPQIDLAIESAGAAQQQPYVDPREGAPPSIDRLTQRGNIKPRFGDSALKPIFGTNPLAEVYDTFVKPFNAAEAEPDPEKAAWLEGRGLGERAMDTGAFALSLPYRMLSRGEAGAGDIVSALGMPGIGDKLSAGEEDFTRANEDQLGAFKAAGEAAMGTMGLPMPSIRMPKIPEVPSRQSTGPASFPESGATRAQSYVKKLDELGIHKHGPAIAQAAREGTGPGLFAKTIEGMPFVGRPLQRSTQEFISTASRAADDIAQGYGTGNIESAGASVKSYFDKFKNKRSIAKDDLDALPDQEVARLATLEPKDLGSVKTAADARYETAWRQIPEKFRKGASFEEDPRLMGDMPNTRALLERITNDNVKMTNQQAELRKAGKPKVAEETAAVLPTRKGAALKRVMPFRGGLLEKATQAIVGGSWRGSLQTMRNMRTLARRQASRITDNEGNQGSKGEYEALKQAIDADMRALMARVPERFRAKGDEPMAQAFERAAKGFDDADRFYKQYAEAFEKVAKPLIDTEKNPAVIKKLMDAAKKGTGGDAALLDQYRRMATPEVMDDVAAAAMVDMGRPTGGAGGILQEGGWSHAKFATAWNNMNHEALFSHRPELYAKLKKYADVAQGFADYEKLANSSKSGTHGLIGAALLAGPTYMLTNLDGLLLSAAGSYGAARWLTSPSYVAWLTKSAKLQKQLQKGGVNQATARTLARRHARALQELIARDGQMQAETKADLLRAIAAQQQGANVQRQER
jgi:hypothetical protein